MKYASTDQKSFKEIAETSPERFLKELLDKNLNKLRTIPGGHSEETPGGTSGIF